MADGTGTVTAHRTRLIEAFVCLGDARSGEELNELSTRSLERDLGWALAQNLRADLREDGTHPFDLRIDQSVVGAFIGTFASKRGIRLLGELAHVQFSAGSPYVNVLRSFYAALGHPMGKRSVRDAWTPRYASDTDIIKIWSTPAHALASQVSVWGHHPDVLELYKQGVCFLGQLPEAHGWQAGKFLRLQTLLGRLGNEHRAGMLPRGWVAPGIDPLGHAIQQTVELTSVHMRLDDLVPASAFRRIVFQHVASLDWHPLAFGCAVDPLQRIDWAQFDRAGITTLDQLLLSDPHELVERVPAADRLIRDLRERGKISLPVPRDVLGRNVA